MSKVMQYNPLTHMMEWHDGTDVSAEVFDSMFNADDKMPLLSFFHLQDLRKQRAKRTDEEKPA